MKFFTKQKFIRKTIITLLVVILVNFTMPIQAQASFGGKLFQPITDLIIALADVVVGAMNHSMVGTKHIIGATTLSYKGSKDDTQGNRNLGITCKRLGNMGTRRK